MKSVDPHRGTSLGNFRTQMQEENSSAFQRGQKRGEKAGHMQRIRTQNGLWYLGEKPEIQNTKTQISQILRGKNSQLEFFTQENFQSSMRLE